MVSARKRRVRRGIAVVASACGVAGCSLFVAPAPISDGRSGPPPTRELLVVHGLAQTLGSLELAEDGAPRWWQGNIQTLGSVPSDITDGSDSVWVTLSGENRVRTFDRDTLARREDAILPPGSNPIATVVLPNAALPGRTLTATVSFLSARLSLIEWPAAVAISTATGAAPQTLTTLPPSGSEVARIVVANTAFAIDRPAERPFGAATLSEFRLEVSGSVPGLAVERARTVDLEEPEFDPASESGTNPTELLYLPNYGELLVVGSGINLGGDGRGEDDGILLVLDATTLGERQRIRVGGSPGSIVFDADRTTPRVYLAGTTGIVSLAREAGAWSVTPRQEWSASAPAGTLPLVAAMALFGDFIHAADFALDRILTFRIDSDGTLVAAGAQGVSDGPVAMMVVERP